MSETFAFTASSLSPSEMHIYRYLLKNRAQVKHMTIRELSAASYVSTASVMRLVRKFGYPGYSEFQSSLQKDDTCADFFFHDEREFSLNTFFEITCKETEFLHSLKRAAAILSADRNILFTGDAYGRCACESGIALFERSGWKADFLDQSEIHRRRAGTCALVILGSSSEQEAKQIVSSLPVGYIPVIMIYCGGYRPSFPCDEISCVLEEGENAKVCSLIPAVHTLELLQKQAILLC